MVSTFNVRWKNLLEDGAKYTVDQEICCWVDHKEDGRDKAKDNDPDWEPSKVGASTEGDLVNDSYLMHIEEDAENVTENK